mmetsp:Transcript_4418/g.6461  ORF Transcript_4418/g.6461 Transcript_4418/m.6461 type:complete len:100 (+) Transcript_4418:1298-1597(+)
MAEPAKSNYKDGHREGGNRHPRGGQQHSSHQQHTSHQQRGGGGRGGFRGGRGHWNQKDDQGDDDENSGFYDKKPKTENRRNLNRFEGIEQMEKQYRAKQ